MDLANAFDTLAEAYRARSRLGTWGGMLGMLIMAFGIYQSSLGYASWSHGLEDIERSSTKSGDAQQSFTKPFDVYKSLRNEMGWANVLAGLGDPHLSHPAGSSGGALHPGLTIYEGESNILGRASVFSRLGVIHLERSRYSDAEGLRWSAGSLEGKLGRTNASILLGRLQKH